MNRKYATILLSIGAILLLASGGIYGWLNAQGNVPSILQPWPSPTPTPRPIPSLQITPPPSLEELAERYPQLATILQDNELDSVYKSFLVAYQEGGESAALELARKRGLLTPNEKEVRVTLVLDIKDPTALIQQLETVGVTIASAHEDQINISVPLELIRQQLESDQPGAIFTQLTELEHVIAVRLPPNQLPDGSPINGEGVGVIGADSWHQAGITGKGVRIGILDLGFSGYEDLEGEELPESVTIEKFGWYDKEEVHGAACAEIVHEVAPDAELYLAWYDGSDASMGEAIDWLLEQDVRIISHSASTMVGPRDGTSTDSQMVDDVASRGVLWVNSAGNQGTGHYRAIYNDSDGNNTHEFATGVEVLALETYGRFSIYLNWEDDWQEPQQDFDIYLVDANGDLLASSENTQDGSIGQEPLEWFSYDSDVPVYLYIQARNSANSGATLDLFTHGAYIESAYNTPDHSLCPPADAIGALTVGATEWKNDQLADYSSQGPTEDGRLKPDICAPAGVSGATYGRRGFDGTSASTPHVAGAAALFFQAYPDYDRTQITQLMLDNAVDLGPDGPDTGYGNGRLQLPQAPQLSGDPEPIATWEPEDDPEPLPTPSPIAYTTPEPGMPIQSSDYGMLGIAVVLIGGVACVGFLMVGIGIIVLLYMAFRPKKQPAPSRPQAPPPGPRIQPGIPPPPPVAPTPPATPAGRRCTQCGNPLTPTAQFCNRCGHPTTPAAQAQCKYCGSPLNPGARFCPKCGKPTQ